MTPPVVSAEAARLLLLGAQGLLDDPRGKATADGLYELIERMGFVQVDSINIVERAHHLTLAARVQGYRPKLLDAAAGARPPALRALDARRLGDPHGLVSLLEAALRALPPERARAPLVAGAGGAGAPAGVRRRARAHRARGAADGQGLRGRAAGRRRDKTWWGWKPQKAALEYLWRTGELAVARRQSFHKVYDLRERVLPEAHAAPGPDVRGAPRLGLPHGPGTAGDRDAGEIAGFWHAVSLEEAKAWCERAAAAGEIAEVQVEAADGSAAAVRLGRAGLGGPRRRPAPGPAERSACSRPSIPSCATASAPCACSVSTTASRPSSPGRSASTATT